VIAGDVDLDDATRAGRSLLSALPTAPAARLTSRAEGKSGRVVIDGLAEARAALMPDLRTPQAAWTLAAAFAVASELDESFVSYSPSIRPGLVTVGVTGRTSGAGLKIDELARTDSAGLTERGRSLTRTWLERQLRTPAGVAALRGQLLVQDRSARPETLLEHLERMTPAEFAHGLAAFAAERAVVVVGVPR
jgi:hypothetical protein